MLSFLPGSSPGFGAGLGLVVVDISVAVIYRSPVTPILNSTLV